MKVLLINKFLYPKGGDAITTLATGNLLSSKGHKTIFWGMQHPLNPRYFYEDMFVTYINYDSPIGVTDKLKTTLNILYSLEAKKKVEELVKKEKPEVVHLNNFAHQISPSILDVFNKYNIPSVMTLHDYKLVCPSYQMLSDGQPCGRCKNGRYYWCSINKCAKDSYARSLVNTLEMYLHHSILHIYDKVDVFISPSKFLGEKVKEMGFRRKTVYLPNFIDAENYVPKYNFDEKRICYFGRLSKEKGLFTLVDAVKKMDVGLVIIGDGPIEESLRSKVRNEKLKNVDFLGYRSGEDLRNEIRNSMVVVVPSECCENNPRTILEAFALGKPVIGSKIGGIPELVKDGETGITFEAGNSEDLRNKIENFLGKPDLVIQTGRNARRFVEENFNSEKHYQGLMKIYQMVIEKHKSK